MIDFKTVAKTPITDVAAWLGITGLAERHNEQHGVQFCGKCPISNGTNPTSFKLTPGINRFICWCTSCKALPKPGGDAVELVSRVRKISQKDAAAAIAGQFLAGGAGRADDNDRPQQEAVADARKPSSFNPLDYLKTLATEHDELTGLDILPETLVLFQAGYCNKGLNRGRLAVALHDLNGPIRMFIGVALDGAIPRYLAPKGEELPYWFNAHRLETEGEPLRIVSDVLEVMQAVENGCMNVICPLRPVEALSLAALTSLVKMNKLTVEF